MQGTQEHKGVITFKGNALTLIGSSIKKDEKAPDAQITDNNLNTISLLSLIQKPTILLSVPSLDTDVCSRESKKFNEKIDEFEGKLGLITVSMDLPFAQKRWCAAENIKNLKTVSDFKEASFGKNYGVLIKELHLLARAVFLIDKNKIIKNIIIVKEVTDEPDYNQILQEARSLI